MAPLFGDRVLVCRSGGLELTEILLSIRLPEGLHLGTNGLRLQVGARKEPQKIHYLNCENRTLACRRRVLNHDIFTMWHYGRQRERAIAQCGVGETKNRAVYPSSSSHRAVLWGLSLASPTLHPMEGGGSWGDKMLNCQHGQLMLFPFTVHLTREGATSVLHERSTGFLAKQKQKTNSWACTRWLVFQQDSYL